MARTTRSGAVAVINAISLATGRDYREKVRREKARKKHEAEQAKKKKNGTNDRESRAQAMEIEALYDATDAEATVRHSPSPAQPAKRRTRQDTPSCSDYGILRHITFNKPTPKWHLCGQCDAWDNDKNIVCNINQSSRTYKCVAGHTSFLYPTTPLQPKGVRLRAQYQPAPRRLAFDESSRNRMDLDESDKSSNDGSNSDVEEAFLPEVDPSTLTTEQLMATNERLRVEKEQDIVTISELKKTIHNLRRKIRYAELVQTTGGATDEESSPTEDPAPCSPAVKSGRKGVSSENGRFHEDLTHILNELISKRGWGRDRVGRELATFLFEYDDELCHEALIKKAKNWLRKNVFTCYNILREMDRAGGTLGYEGIEIIRSAETKQVKRYRGSLIPSSAEFKRTARKVEKLAHSLAPFVVGLTAAGDKEAIDFQPYWKIMGTVFRAYGLIISSPRTVERTRSSSSVSKRTNKELKPCFSDFNSSPDSSTRFAAEV